MQFLKNIFFIVFTVLSINSFCQDVQNEIMYDITTNYGFTTPNIKPKKFYIESRLKGFNFYRGKKTNDSVSWNKNFKYPDHGFGLLFNFIDQNNILGNQFTLYYKINIPLYPVKKIGIYYSTAIGPSLITKPFRVSDAYLNHANGSLINIFAHFGLNSRILLFEKYYVKLGLNFYHISNGNFKLPNDGLNIIAFETGLSFLQYKNKLVKNRSRPNINNAGTKYISVNFARKQREIVGESYFIFNLSTDYYFKKYKRRSFGLGIDFNFDNSLSYDPANLFYRQKNQIFYNGVYLTHFLNFGNFILLTNIGYYLDYYKIIDDNIFYYIGFRYFFAKKLYFNFGLKARFSGGDFVGFGIGYSFN